MINLLTFPVLALKEADKRIYAFSDKNKLTRTSIELLNKNIFRDTSIIDSNGGKFSIVKIIKKSWGTPFGGYSPFWKGRLINIDFELKLEGKVSIDDLKKDLLEKIKENKLYSLEELYPLITGATQYSNLYKLFY